MKTKPRYHVKLTNQENKVVHVWLELSSDDLELDTKSGVDRANAFSMLNLTPQARRIHQHGTYYNQTDQKRDNDGWDMITWERVQ
ncbi:hypothetical protein [Marinobacter sp.]|jgi:hypothetical protein|uniref:hypothetical protein n=1 Tax=Marinobacter sp. TaxID=50741 RepID=UPI000C891302|nr:hypothetical protein [Marinobacter sp.]MAK51605.1 hypothetical protein [Marinobacter sp.]|tara:strand:+ start:960 stop:1214 length:255 start_codon:yes stop_codon:yes gene_type:complete